MLSKNEKYIMKRIVRFAKEKDITKIDTKEGLYDLVKNKVSEKELDLILDSLHKKGYISTENYTPYGGWGEHGRVFEVDNDTLNHYELKSKERISFLINSILLPILMSVVTTLATMLLSGYFK